VLAGLQSLLPFASCLALSAALTPLARAGARGLGLLDMPGPRKAHREPMPLMGGTAVFAALAVGTGASGLLTGRTTAIVVGCVVLFALGLWDDTRGLGVRAKFAAQIAAALLAVALGLVVRVTGNPPVDAALTLLWLIGLTNALNLLDNMDGLSSGAAAVIALFLFFAATIVGDGQAGALALCVCGAALGFLLYNFPPATVFLGDAGSMVYGFALAGVGVLLMNDFGRSSDMLAVPAILGLPTLDTTLVTVVRPLEGRRVSEGGRDHMSHRLSALGLSPRAVAWTHYGLAAAFGAAGVAYLHAGVAARIVLVVGFLATAVVTGVGLGRVKVQTRQQTSGDSVEA
jgi:UDP-GlcNAc:undecaprenyl-phosphate GlcNAc-1-phosphate transferase